MMRESLLSVIIPVYNAKKYLVRCIESVVNQTYKRIEVILIDDGSDDGSAKICDDMAEKYSNIKVIHKKNEGVSRARNEGLDIALGEYVAFVDSDDYIDDEMYENMILEMEKDLEIDVCICLWKFINREGKNVVQEENISFKSYGKQKGRGFIANIYNDSYSNGIVVSPCNKVFRKKVFSDLRYKGRYAEDDWLMTRIFTQKDICIKVIKELYYNYCENEFQMTKIKNNENKIDFMDCLLERIKFFEYDDKLKRKTQKLYEEICIEYFRDIGNSDRFTKKYKEEYNKNFWLLVFDKTIRLKTKIRWMIFLLSPDFYKKYILK